MMAIVIWTGGKIIERYVDTNIEKISLKVYNTNRCHTVCSKVLALPDGLDTIVTGESVFPGEEFEEIA